MVTLLFDGCLRAVYPEMSLDSLSFLQERAMALVAVVIILVLCGRSEYSGDSVWILFEWPDSSAGGFDFV